MDFFHRPEDPLNFPGYWGQRTSAVDWCEPNYTYSFYIAEFFNTITSLPAVFLALRSLYFTYKYGYDKRYIVVNLMVMLVGLGSAAFHGSLLYTGQIMDELPMVYASLALLYSVLEMESTEKKTVYKYLAPAILVFCGIFTAVYLYLPDFFIFFLVAYILCILTIVYNCVLIYRKPETVTHQKLFIVLAAGSYVGGWLFFWVPEVAACETLKSYNFHSWWHVTSTVGAFFFVLFSTYERELKRGRRPQLNYNSFAGVPLLPFVHIPSAKELIQMDKKELISKESESINKAERSNTKRKSKSKLSSESR